MLKKKKKKKAHCRGGEKDAAFGSKCGVCKIKGK